MHIQYPYTETIFSGVVGGSRYGRVAASGNPGESDSNWCIGISFHWHMQKSAKNEDASCWWHCHGVYWNQSPITCGIKDGNEQFYQNHDFTLFSWEIQLSTCNPFTMDISPNIIYMHTISTGDYTVYMYSYKRIV